MQKSTLFIIGLCLALIGGGLVYRYFVRDADSRGATKLMRTIEDNGSLKDTAKLIAKTADINITDKKGKTALLYAAEHGRDKALIDQLLQAGADINHTDKKGRTALMIAAQENPSAAVVQALLIGGADINEMDPQGNTPLLLAAKYNEGAVIETLLRANADLLPTDKNGNRAEDLLATNLHLTDVEKNNYRQLFLILSILEAREQTRLQGFLQEEGAVFELPPSHEPVEEAEPTCQTDENGACTENPENTEPESENQTTVAETADETKE